MPACSAPALNVHFTQLFVPNLAAAFTSALPSMQASTVESLTGMGGVAGRPGAARTVVPPTGGRLVVLKGQHTEMPEVDTAKL